MREDSFTDTDPLDPMDPLRHLRGLGLAASLTSEDLGWRGIRVARYRYSRREIEQPPFENHLVTLVVTSGDVVPVGLGWVDPLVS